MQKLFIKKVNCWLLPAVLILFVLQVVMLPWAVDFTWAGRNEAPDHSLTYTPGKLTWDEATAIRYDGVAQLDLFHSKYGDTVLANGKAPGKLIAPGTQVDAYIRFKNDSATSVNYVAVLYSLRSDERIPVRASLSGDNLTDILEYYLPDGVKKEQVIRTVKGSVNAGQIQDFDISWIWDFERGEQNAVDTMLGNLSVLPNITVGFYLVVEDDGSYIRPDLPQTGDKGYAGLYLGLMAVSFAVLLLLLWDRRREEKGETC